MTDTTVPDLSGTSAPRARRLTVPILLQLGAMVGIGALVYSSAADWFSAIGHNSEVSGYVHEVDALPDESRLDKLQAAHDYNTQLPAGTLRDPYAAGGDNADLHENSAYLAYEEVLRVSDTGVIGEVSYPRLGIGLPIYHGTGHEAISRGVGHLYGSSLPVGGPSTHSVMTSHSGLLNASLFTPLLDATPDDTFTVTVLGETHHYRVDAIDTIEPFVTDSLAVVDGEDRVTLITCTPIGVNSHRFLVHGVRVPDPDTASRDRVIAGDGRSAGFPWWALVFVGGSVAIGYLLFAPPRRQRNMNQIARRHHEADSTREQRE